MGKLNGKYALITGGTTGIGLATAVLFQKEGAKVAVTGRTDETLASAKETLGADAIVVKSQAGDLGDIESLIAQLGKEWGRLDVLFINAGVGDRTPVEEVTEETFDQQFDINVKGPFFTVQQALPLIPEGGSILLNASIAANKGFAGMPVYSATKAAVRSFGRTLASHLAPRNIRVNTISPGPVATPIMSKMGVPAESATDVAKSLAELTAMKRLGQPEEIATTALFLASDDSSFMTGTELVVDGGVQDL